ncbi:MAG TPA: DNA repair protein RadA, partial [Patescibacteria group bacterium]|nr:DNA repair protein RadA [Patescibacteria group bacterium]
MAKTHSRYVCQACGDAFLRWEGQCRTCGAWNTLVETVVRESARSARAAGPVAAGVSGRTRPQPLGEVVEPEVPRLSVGIGELDRVLGGGLVPGSLVLVGGEPGIGKSTLLLQAASGVAGRLASAGGHVLYATGEESAGQVRLRAARLGLLDGSAGIGVRVVAENEIGRVIELAREDRPGLVIVDSIQTATVDELDGPAGSVGQVRESALRLMELAKGDGIAVVLVGHVTKDGTIAGPKTLEHLVDAVLGLEGDRSAGLRLLRASKNRFGSTEEVGVFEMGELGLVELTDP